VEEVSTDRLPLDVGLQRGFELNKPYLVEFGVLHSEIGWRSRYFLSRRVFDDRSTGCYGTYSQSFALQEVVKGDDIRSLEQYTG
jgi:hypothetical protein